MDVCRCKQPITDEHGRPDHFYILPEGNVLIGPVDGGSHYVASGEHDGHHAYFCMFCGKWMWSLILGEGF